MNGFAQTVVRVGAFRDISHPQPMIGKASRWFEKAMGPNVKIQWTVSAKFVLGENISQAASFVVSGSADVGIVGLALALAPTMKEKGRYIEIPETVYPPIDQAAVALKSSQQKEVAGQFIKFLKTPQIQEVLQAYGFSVPRDLQVNP